MVDDVGSPWDNEFMTTITEDISTDTPGAYLRVVSRPSGVTLVAANRFDVAAARLDPVDHFRLASHLAHQLGFLPVTEPEKVVAWILPGPDGVYLGAPKADPATWWAISMTDPHREPVTVADPEPLWPLIDGGTPVGERDGAYCLTTSDGQYLARYDAFTKTVAEPEEVIPCALAGSDYTDLLRALVNAFPQPDWMTG